MGPRRFLSAREMFEAVREASRDAERIRRQLEDMEARAEGMGGASGGPRVSATGEPDRMGSRVAALVDMESMLAARQAEDYALIDAACRVLYGDGNDGGLWALVGWRADAICQHYVNGLTWEQVGALMGYTAQHCWQQAQVAFEVADGWGMAATMAGVGRAEG